ncbi:MAG: hypothetical protein DMG31_19540 [Acidobacteria bacterium]|nr:MAG: hypothetical protein DMG31_19540 [Acidobacteriota bacterium]
MPIVNGNYYMNGDYGQSLEQDRIADAFPGLADQTGSGNSLEDRLVDHLTTPRSATEPPPPPAPPGMPPEAYDDMKINKLTGRQVANIIANEDRDVTRGTSSPEEIYQSKVWKAHAIINGDRTYGGLRLDRVHTAPSEVTPELENSPQYQQALAAARQAFQEQLGGKDPTDGRMWFNNRPTASTALRNLNPKDPNARRVGVFKVFGPFQKGNQNVYTDINENQNPMPGLPRKR